MIFKKSLAAWHQTDLKPSLIEEIKTQAMPVLQQQLRHSSVALSNDLSLMILKKTDQTETVSATLGIFFSGIISGCNCSDDPSDFIENEYCELIVSIDKNTGLTLFKPS